MKLFINLSIPFTVIFSVGLNVKGISVTVCLGILLSCSTLKKPFVCPLISAFIIQSLSLLFSIGIFCVIVSFKGQKNSKVALISFGFTSTNSLYILISLGLSRLVNIISPSYTMQTLEVNLTFKYITPLFFCFLLSWFGGSGIEPGNNVAGTA